jgi:hypothetical protein
LLRCRVAFVDPEPSPSNPGRDSGAADDPGDDADDLLAAAQALYMRKQEIERMESSAEPSLAATFYEPDGV